ncbi:hypothetical protein D9M68_669590 [compost metagenome]
MADVPAENDAFDAVQPLLFDRGLDQTHDFLVLLMEEQPFIQVRNRQATLQLIDAFLVYVIEKHQVLGKRQFLVLEPPDQVIAADMAIRPAEEVADTFVVGAPGRGRKADQ